MKTLQKLKAHYTTLCKVKDSASAKALATLIEDLEQGKDITGKLREHMDAALNKAKLSTNIQDKASFLAEAAFFESLMSNTLTGADILKIMDKNCVTTLGEGMRILKSRYFGMYDSHEASTLIREYLG